ncbi:MAG: YebC/PmpR family DNA-binding transcriptional regulator [Deltaproteobacteria bacterium]|nr:YebC/PmpR family DNA-binding transcriptional regulator [Deltaproteobacteria bacterium]
MGAQWKQKGREAGAAAKGKLFTKLAKEIAVAAKSGADPAGNPRLQRAVEAAKKASMPRDTLERAIKRGSGGGDESMQYEVVYYEGFTPHRVPVIVECLTENKNRTAGSMRGLFRKGQLAAAGAVSWDFAHLGFVEATPPAPGTDAETAAIEAGAQDFEVNDDGSVRFFTDATDVDVVSKALTAAKWTLTSAKLGWRAKNPVTVPDAARAEVEAFLAELDDDDDVQDLYVAMK